MFSLCQIPCLTIAAKTEGARAIHLIDAAPSPPTTTKVTQRTGKGNTENRKGIQASESRGISENNKVALFSRTGKKKMKLATS